MTQAIAKRVVLTTTVYAMFHIHMVNAQACKPITLLMTRATNQPAAFTAGNSSWTPQYDLSTVNTASVNGALKFVITETIDANDGYSQECTRKNAASYIHFYEVQVCNPDAALWWFNTGPGYRQAGYGGDKDGFDFGEYGQYLTMDSGQCHDNPYCDSLHGVGKAPEFGPFVGWQDVQQDDRNPTKLAYWYSLPGECPTKVYDDKSEACKKGQLSGQCPPGMIPDGVQCTWSYTMMGQVSLDDLSGISKVTNPATGQPHTAISYCQAGEIEFKRDESFEYVEGLDFWKDPLDQEANAVRIEKLLQAYGKGANNKPLLSVTDLKALNPRCYESTPNCFDGTAETCTRDDEMLCVPCAEVKGGCAAVTDVSTAFDAKTLKIVETVSVDSGDAGLASQSASSAVTLATSFGVLVGAAVLMAF